MGWKHSCSCLYKLFNVGSANVSGSLRDGCRTEVHSL